MHDSCVVQQNESPVLQFTFVCGDLITYECIYWCLYYTVILVHVYEQDKVETNLCLGHCVPSCTCNCALMLKIYFSMFHLQCIN